MDNDIRKNIAVIGCGYWGKNLVRVFYEINRLSCVCDSSENRLSEINAKYAGVKTTRDFKEVLKDTDIEGVVISTPAETHHSLVRDSLEHKKNVFVEKPLALTVAEGAELVDLAAKNNKILMVGHILQYHPAVIALRNLIKKGDLGKIQYVYSNRLNFGKIRREENILWSFAPHDISVILGLLGELPEEVSARGFNYLHPEIADVTISQMKFKSGINAHIFVSWLHPFKEQKLVIAGEKKMAVFDDTLSWDKKLILYPHEIVWSGGVPEAKKAQGSAVLLEEREPLRCECEHFVDCVNNRHSPITGGDEGLRVLNVLNSLQESLDSGGRSVLLKKHTSKYFAHETAVVDASADVGEGSKIWHFSHIMKNTKLGLRCNIGQNVVVSPNVMIGNNVKIQNNVSVYTGVIVEDDAFLGPSMVFTNVNNPRSFIERKNEYRTTLVKKGATIGANSTVVCGHTIGEYSFIGAGAVVTKDISPYALVVGNPAKVVGWVCKCGVKLDMTVDDNDETSTCSACSQKYIRKGNKVEATL